MFITSRKARAALVMLGVGTFSYVTIEVLPIGLLTVIAADLGRSRSDVGLLVTGYAAVVVLTSIPLARLTLRLRGSPRRTAAHSALTRALLVDHLPDRDRTVPAGCPRTGRREALDRLGARSRDRHTAWHLAR